MATLMSDVNVRRNSPRLPSFDKQLVQNMQSVDGEMTNWKILVSVYIITPPRQ